MKKYTRILCLALILCLIVCVVIVSCLWFFPKEDSVSKKEEPVKENAPKEETKEENITPAIDVMFDYDYKNMSLQEIMDSFLQTNKIDASLVSISYYNFSDEETYHLNENTVRIAASTYKLPLNIVVYNEIASGKYTLDSSAYYYKHAQSDGDTALQYQVDSYVPLKYLLSQSIVDSDNTASLILVEHVGGWYSFVEKADALVASTYPKDNNYSNLMTSQFALDILKYVYTNQAKYPQLIAYMKKACANDYGQKYITEVEVAHKYGYYDVAHNDTMLVFGTRPFAAAIYTEYLNKETVSQISRILYEYSELH